MTPDSPKSQVEKWNGQLFTETDERVQVGLMQGNVSGGLPDEEAVAHNT